MNARAPQFVPSGAVLRNANVSTSSSDLKIYDGATCPFAHLVVTVRVCSDVTSSLPVFLLSFLLQSPHDVYIGRPGRWGNPFKIGPHGDREAVIRKYHHWLTSTPEALAHFLRRCYSNSRTKSLGCWLGTGIAARRSQRAQGQSVGMPLRSTSVSRPRLGHAGQSILAVQSRDQSSCILSTNTTCAASQLSDSRRRVSDFYSLLSFCLCSGAVFSDLFLLGSRLATADDLLGIGSILTSLDEASNLDGLTDAVSGGNGLP